MTSHSSLSRNQSLLHPLNQEASESKPTFNNDLAREFYVVAQSHSENSTSFNVEISPNTIFDACLYNSYYVQVVIDGTDIAGTNAQNWHRDLGGFALAQYPMHRVCNSLQVRFNNNSQTINPSQYHNALIKYSDELLDQRLASMCPTKPDPVGNHTLQSIFGQNYGYVYHNGTVVFTEGQCVPVLQDTGIEGSQLVPHWYSKSGDRSHITPYSVVHNSATRSTYVFKVTEPIHHPWLSDATSRDTLGNIRTIGVEIGYLTNKAPMFTTGLVVSKALQSMVADRQFSDLTLRTRLKCTVSLDFAGMESKPRLLMRTFVPNVSIPAALKMETQRIVVRTTDVTLEATKSTTVQTADYVADQCPDEIFMFLQRRSPKDSSDNADVYGCIEKLTFRTDNNSGGLEGASVEQLYQMCARNGLNQSFDDFAYNIGSVIKLDMHESDIGAVVPGSRAPFSFSITATFAQNRTGSEANRDVASTRFSRIVRVRSATPALRNGDFEDFEVGNDDWQFVVVMVMNGHMVADGNSLALSYGHSVQSVLDARRNGIDPTEVPGTAVTGTGGGLFKSKAKEAKKEGIRQGKKVFNKYASGLAKKALNKGMEQGSSALNKLIDNKLGGGGTGGGLMLHG